MNESYDSYLSDLPWIERQFRKLDEYVFRHVPYQWAITVQSAIGIVAGILIGWAIAGFLYH